MKKIKVILVKPNMPPEVVSLSPEIDISMLVAGDTHVLPYLTGYSLVANRSQVMRAVDDDGLYISGNFFIVKNGAGQVQSLRQTEIRYLMHTLTSARPNTATRRLYNIINAASEYDALYGKPVYRVVYERLA